MNEAHERLILEAMRLADRLNLAPPRDGLLPTSAKFLAVVPALHAIVDRLEKLERMARPMSVEEAAYEEWKRTNASAAAEWEAIRTARKD